jgi:hypothetical protein
MGDTNNILKDLKNHRAHPPEGVFAKIWLQIKKLNLHGNKLPHNLEYELPDESSEAVEPAYENSFRELQSYVDAKIKPPAFDLTALSPASKKQKKPVVTLFIKVAAALAIIVLGILFLLRNDKSDSQNHAGTNQNPDTAVSTNEWLAVSGSKNETPGRKNQSHLPQQPIRDYAIVPGRKVQITKHLQAEQLYAEFFYTLTNFSYEEAFIFLNDLKKTKKISLSNFSYVIISDKMAAFMECLYKLNKKNKPSREAKKARAKLEKWRKKDESYFDKKLDKNPLDIFDLQEFIFKN